MDPRAVHDPRRVADVEFRRAWIDHPLRCRERGARSTPISLTATSKYSSPTSKLSPPGSQWRGGICTEPELGPSSGSLGPNSIFTPRSIWMSGHPRAPGSARRVPTALHRNPSPCLAQALIHPRSRLFGSSEGGSGEPRRRQLISRSSRSHRRDRNRQPQAERTDAPHWRRTNPLANPRCGSRSRP